MTAPKQADSRRYLIPAGRGEAELEAKGSQFIAWGARVLTLEDVHALVDEAKKRYPDASHHCVAYRLGDDGKDGEWSTDDGEPRGTAGKPMLSALQGAKLGEVAAVVIRYFGGTKLGTGGLVRAYGGATRELLEVLPTCLKVPRKAHLLATPYASYERIKECLLSFEAEIAEEDFGADITFSFTLPLDRYDECAAEITTLSLGQIELLDDE